MPTKTCQSLTGLPTKGLHAFISTFEAEGFRLTGPVSWQSAVVFALIKKRHKLAYKAMALLTRVTKQQLSEACSAAILFGSEIASNILESCDPELVNT